MALVSAGFFLTVDIADSGGNKSRLSYSLTSADLATAVTDVATILAELDPVTDGVVTGYRFGEAYAEDTAFFAVAGVQIENIASIVARIDAPMAKYANIKIPAPAPGIFQAANGPLSNEIDPADTDLVAYLNLFETAGGVVTLSDGETLVSPGTAGNVKGKRIHRRSRKG